MGYGRSPPIRATPPGQVSEKCVTSNYSRPTTCGAGIVEAEQKRRAAREWKRREDIFEGARKHTGDMMVTEDKEWNDTNSL